MKSILSFLLFSVHALPTPAQNDLETGAPDTSSTVPSDTIHEFWSTSGVMNINMTQVSLTNWAAGGYNTISGAAMFNGTANWKKGRKAWDNSLVLAFGGLKFAKEAPLKTDDRIEVNSKFGYELKKDLYLAGVFQFRTQFTEGFNVTGQRISNFMAPGYTLLGVGADYRPSDNFTVFLSPATARIVTVNDGKLFEGLAEDERVFGVENGNSSELEIGAYLRFQYKRELAKNIAVLTRGDLFGNYLRKPQQIDVTWETLWTFTVNEWFAATLNTVLIDDQDIQLPKVDDQDITYTGPGTQFKETFGIGLSFKL